MKAANYDQQITETEVLEGWLTSYAIVPESSTKLRHRMELQGDMLLTTNHLTSTQYPL